MHEWRHSSLKCVCVKNVANAHTTPRIRDCRCSGKYHEAIGSMKIFDRLLMSESGTRHDGNELEEKRSALALDLARVFRSSTIPEGWGIGL